MFIFFFEDTKVEAERKKRREEVLRQKEEQNNKILSNQPEHPSVFVKNFFSLPFFFLKDLFW